VEWLTPEIGGTEALHGGQCLQVAKGVSVGGLAGAPWCLLEK
jgi:hypothetical protein